MTAGEVSWGLAERGGSLGDVAGGTVHHTLYLLPSIHSEQGRSLRKCAAAMPEHCHQYATPLWSPTSSVSEQVFGEGQSPALLVP